MGPMERLQVLTGHLRAVPAKEETKLVRENETRALRKITRSKILEKREQGECWIVIHGKVYDVTEFLDEHPGGAEIITDIDEADFETQTQEFDDAEHSEEALEDMEDMLVGIYVDEDSEDYDPDEDLDDVERDAEDEEEEESEGVLEDEELTEELERTPFAVKQEIDLALMDQVQLSHDVVVYRFALPEPDHRFGLPIGQHIILSFNTADGAKITRPYTPVSPQGERGFVDFLVKTYPNGKMSTHLKSLQAGDMVRMKGPKGHLRYFGCGTFQIRKQKRKLRQVGMICGGSGITPMFQIIQAVANDPNDQLKITLLFANKMEEDIILRDVLETYAASKPNITVMYTLDNPSQGWKGYSGYVTKEMILETMPGPSQDSMVFLCGPPPMIKKACIPNLKELGYVSRKDFFSF